MAILIKVSGFHHSASSAEISLSKDQFWKYLETTPSPPKVVELAKGYQSDGQKFARLLSHQNRKAQSCQNQAWKQKMQTENRPQLWNLGLVLLNARQFSPQN
ncbi:hypothetical protein CUMW_228420 [Citrus unshiu]|uniref:Uncharacterized protein n=1 Tax=Citrus unshiu TaxID=55188 RepID=A0A2H5QGM6_CITUN|nr:hypothetical protein CUMW_228420 [Citrus unshiu]